MSRGRTHRFSPIVVCSLAPASATTTMLAERARGGVIMFNSRPTWISAGGSATVTEDFHTFISDTSFRNNVTVNLAGGMSLTEVGPASWSDGNFIDVPPFIPSGNESVNGTTDAAIGVYKSSTPSENVVVRLAFSSPTTAWGADFAHAAGGTIAAADLFNDANVLLGTISVTTENQFLGFTTTAGDSVKYMNFHALNINGLTGEFFQIDSVSLPEPGGMALIAGVGALVASRRRRTEKAENRKRG
jgi:hypothetical protein